MSFKFTPEKNIFMYYIDAIYKKQFLDWKCKKNVLCHMFNSKTKNSN